MSPSSRTEQRENVDRAAALTLMMLFLFVTYTPYGLVLAAMALSNGAFASRDWFVYLEKFTMKLVLLNNVGNPVMYGWKDAHIKRYVRKTLWGSKTLWGKTLWCKALWGKPRKREIVVVAAAACRTERHAATVNHI